MWDLIRRNPRSVAWVVVVWMITVIVLLLVGPVIKL
jgi:hypothetical protein